jgi:endonuclease/exonuclease/phosphatase family metal-dependent hydrolase
MIQNRNIILSLVLALTLGFLAWAAARGGDISARQQLLRVATWNLQWLVDPATAHEARIACRDGRAAPLPCDVARTLARDSADFGKLAALVRRLDADVIAFQEVQSEAIAQRVFRGYQICIATGAGVQHTGFAVRDGLNIRCDAPLTSLATSGRARAGQVLTLFPPDGPPIELLSVHLKSGCARDPLHSPTAACRQLAEQAQALGEWIHPRAIAGSAFIVLGDLNRGGLPDADDEFWALLHPDAFTAAASQLPFRNCVFGAPYGDFIDHILVAQSLLPRLHTEGFRQMRFQPGEATRYLLSDHCPVSVSLSLSHSL